MKAYQDAAAYVGAGVAGAMLGRVAVLKAGWKAAGLMGGGSGVGTSAMRAGVVFGTTVGLSVYGLGRTVAGVYTAAHPKAPEKPVEPPVEKPAKPEAVAYKREDGKWTKR